jgi:hypothetical protein
MHHSMNVFCKACGSLYIYFLSLLLMFVLLFVYLFIYIYVCIVHWLCSDLSDMHSCLLNWEGEEPLHITNNGR